MAKLQYELKGDFTEVLLQLDRCISKGSISASLEDGSDFSAGGCRCAVRVYERYSMLGNNRVSMSLTLLEAGGRLFLSAITSGGSQAVFFKVNTFGESAFLESIRGVVEKYRA